MTVTCEPGMDAMAATPDSPGPAALPTGPLMSSSKE